MDIIPITSGGVAGTPLTSDNVTPAPRGDTGFAQAYRAQAKAPNDNEGRQGDDTSVETGVVAAEAEGVTENDGLGEKTLLEAIESLEIASKGPEAVPQDIELEVPVDEGGADVDLEVEEARLPSLTTTALVEEWLQAKPDVALGGDKVIELGAPGLSSAIVPEGEETLVQSAGLLSGRTDLGPLKTNISPAGAFGQIVPVPATPRTIVIVPATAEQDIQQIVLTWPAAQTAIKPEIALQTAIVQSAAQLTNARPTLGADLKDTAGKAVDPALSAGLELAAADGRTDPSRTVTQTQAAVMTRADLPVNVARQIAEVMQRAPDRAVELQLQPAELGRVKMTLAPSELGIAVSILAERPETLDLMRRNIGALEQAMAELGYQDIAFDFGTQSETDPQDPDGDSPPAQYSGLVRASDEPLETPIVETNTVMTNDGRVDTRM